MLKTGNSYYTYSYTLPKSTVGSTVTVSITQKTAEQEAVSIYDTTNEKWENEVDLTVGEGGKVSVIVGYKNAPTQSAKSTFDLTFSYEEANEEKEATVTDLKFDYVVDYDVDLKDGNWKSKVGAPKADYWSGVNVAEQYVKDVIANPAIFQSDARYSTSLNIKKAEESFTGLKSFRAYFNDVFEDDPGCLNVQMNYEVKGGEGSKFTFRQYNSSEKTSWVDYTFKDFDISCNFITANGYEFSWDGTNKCFILTDPNENYDLIGRMKGTFTASAVDENHESKFDEQAVEYNDIIQYDGSGSTLQPKDVAFMFAFALVQLTYNFQWGAEETALKVYSSYAQNAA